MSGRSFEPAMRAVDRVLSLLLLAWTAYILIWAATCFIGVPDLARDQMIVSLGASEWSGMLFLAYFEFYGAVLWLLAAAGAGYALSRVGHKLCGTGRPPCGGAVYKIPERTMLAISGLGLLNTAYLCLLSLYLSGSIMVSDNVGAVLGVILFPVVLGASVILIGLCAAMCAGSIPIARHLCRWYAYFIEIWRPDSKNGGGL